MSSPFEILANPMTIWLATAGTAKPAIDDATLTGWTKLGASGDKNYSEDGVMGKHEQTIEAWRALGTTGNRKSWRTEETFSVEVTLVDLTVEQYRRALNNNAVTTTAAGVGVAGSKKINLHQGHDVTQHALLARSVGSSPYGDGWNAQYWVPFVYQDESPEAVFVKGEPVGLKLKFMCLEDATEKFGVFEAQNATAL